MCSISGEETLWKLATCMTKMEMTDLMVVLRRTHCKDGR